ncbi:MAG: ABC transporter ATP-binding protein [Spirochaetes bacterium]|nr:ABC transporter ATP-binding protein [Spirochaetota bacterium]MBP8990734.1 ABC transporter ATP-binding protein [Spirochaetota bacterium]NLJ04088.1 ABC transporter ATP-binding protein [Exilispira sp.]HOV45704.1 ABC transporter ATP-binding protein [Exilispira sp.]HQQ19219.1 ABC transporter ATP-binding protein [Exilispira sp.]
MTTIANNDTNSFKVKFNYIVSLWKEHKYRILLLIFLSLVNTTANTVYPLILRYIIDSLGNPTGSFSLQNAIALLIAASVIAAIFYSSLQANRVFTNLSFSWKITLVILRWLLKQRKKFFHSFSHGELLTRVSDDIEKISWQLCSGIFRFFDSLSIIVFSLIFMFGFSLKLTLYVIIPLFLVVFIMVLFDETWEKLFEKLQEKISSVNNIIEKAFSSIKVIKSCRMEYFSEKEFHQIMQERKKSELKLAFFHGLWHALDLFANQFSLLLIIFFGGKMVIAKQMSLGTFVAFLQYFYLMFDYLYSFAYFFIDINRAFVSIKRHLEILWYGKDKGEMKNDRSLFDEKDIAELENLSNKKIKINEIDSITLKNVYLKIDQRTILEDINLTLKKGDIIGITGEIGSGKSMCMHVIAALEEITEGNIYINDIPIDKIDIDYYQKNIGFVFQEPSLFSVSIKENIILPTTVEQENYFLIYNQRKFLKNYLPLKPLAIKDDFQFEFDSEILNKSIEIAALEDDIKSFAFGLDTLVGPQGYTLSGGQKERITIARAVYVNPSLFIFDDSTRSLDYETEQKVISSIRKNNSNAIIIIVTQRIRSITFTDKILLFEKGKISASGNHQQLLRKSIRYKHLFEKETLGNS